MSLFAVVLFGVSTFAIASTAEPTRKQSAKDDFVQLAAHTRRPAPAVYDLIDQELRRRDSEGGMSQNVLIL